MQLTQENAQARVEELVKIYQDGIDWQEKYEQYLQEASSKHDAKIEIAVEAGESEDRIEQLKESRNGWLERNPKLAFLKAKAESMPKPTFKQVHASLDAVDTIISENEKLIINFMRKHYPTYLNSPHYDDFLNGGRIGLWNCLFDYSPEKGKFSTHASFYIQSSLLDIARQLHGTTRHDHTQIKKYNEAHARLSAKSDKPPTPQQIMKEMGISMEAYQNILDNISKINTMSIEDNHTLEVCPLKFNPEEIAIAKEREDAVINAKNKLTEEERLVIDLKFGSEKEESYSNISMKLAKFQNPNFGEKLVGVNINEIKKIQHRAERKIKFHYSKYEFGGEKPSNFAPVNSSLSSNIDSKPLIKEDLEYFMQDSIRLDELDLFAQ